MPYLPDDLIEEVLLLLSVKSLLRCRCVCKSWYEIICRRDFIYSHHDKSSINRKHRKLIQIWSIDNFPIGRALDINDGIQEQFMLDFEISYSNPLRAAYCNGLLLLNPTHDKFSIWNPSTRRYRKIPDFKHNRKRWHNFDFGYDATTDDYKVIVITNSTLFEVWIFGLKSSRWRRISDFPGYIYFVGGYRNRFVDGCVHFLSRQNRQDVIMAFDVAKETFYVVPLPIYQGQGYLTLQVFEGCLSIICKEYAMVDLYVRKKDEAEFAWIKLFSVTAFNDIFTTLGYSKEGDKILLNYDGEIYSYDPKQASFQEPEWWSFSNDFQFSMYCMESLVSVGS